MCTVYKLVVKSQRIDIVYFIHRLGEWGIEPVGYNIPARSSGYLTTKQHMYDFSNIYDIGFFNHLDSLSTTHLTVRVLSALPESDVVEKAKQMHCSCIQCEVPWINDHLIINSLQLVAEGLDSAGKTLESHIINTYYPDVMFIPSEYFDKKEAEDYDDLQ